MLTNTGIMVFFIKKTRFNMFVFFNFYCLFSYNWTLFPLILNFYFKLIHITYSINDETINDETINDEKIFCNY